MIIYTFIILCLFIFTSLSGDVEICPTYKVLLILLNVPTIYWYKKMIKKIDIKNIKNKIL